MNADGERGIDTAGWFEVDELDEVAALLDPEFINAERVGLNGPSWNTDFAHVVWDAKDHRGFVVVPGAGKFPL